MHEGDVDVVRHVVLEARARRAAGARGGGGAQQAARGAELDGEGGGEAAAEALRVERVLVRAPARLRHRVELRQLRRGHAARDGAVVGELQQQGVGEVLRVLEAAAPRRPVPALPRRRQLPQPARALALVVGGGDARAEARLSRSSRAPKLSASQPCTLPP